MPKNELIKPAYKEVEYTPMQVQELERCMNDCQHFIENYVYVQHPVKGQVLFKLYDYQIEMLNNILGNRLTISMVGRQQGKSILVASYLLWFAAFHSDKICLVASKGQSHATELMDRIRFAYESLPMWLKPGCPFYNRGSIKFDNGSTIMSQATTENTGRGYSLSCVDGSTIVTVKDKRNGEVSNTRVDDLNISLRYSRTTPGITQNDYLQILSDQEEFVDFFGVYTTSGLCIDVQFTDGTNIIVKRNHMIRRDDGTFMLADALEVGDITCTGKVISSLSDVGERIVYDIINCGPRECYMGNGVVNHNCLYVDELGFLPPNIQDKFWISISPTLATGGQAIITSTPNGDTDLFASLWRGAMSGTNGFSPFLAKWDRHPERDEEWARVQRGILSDLKFQQECECEFLSSDELLISSIALAQMKPMAPVNETNGFKFWKAPSISSTYFVGVDISSGIGSDFSVVQVIEFPSMEQVAELRSNKLAIDQLYVRVKWVLNLLKTGRVDIATPEPAPIRKNDHLLSSMGRVHQAATEVVQRGEVYFSYENNGLGQTFTVLMNNDEDFPDVTLISSPGTMGIVTTGKSKAFACLELKRLIERGLLGVKSETLLFEMKNYIAHKSSFAAKGGCTDDLIAAILVIINMFSQISSYEDELHSMLYSTAEAEEAMADEYTPMPMCF